MKARAVKRVASRAKSVAAELAELREIVAVGVCHREALRLKVAGLESEVARLRERLAESERYTITVAGRAALSGAA